VNTSGFVLANQDGHSLGGSLEHKDPQGTKPLNILVRHLQKYDFPDIVEHTATIAFFLANGAKLDIAKDQGDTALSDIQPYLRGSYPHLRVINMKIISSETDGGLSLRLLRPPFPDPKDNNLTSDHVTERIQLWNNTDLWFAYVDASDETQYLSIVAESAGWEAESDNEPGYEPDSEDEYFELKEDEKEMSLRDFVTRNVGTGHEMERGLRILSRVMAELQDDDRGRRCAIQCG
jgi:hypothetical protein